MREAKFTILINGIMVTEVLAELEAPTPEVANLQEDSDTKEEEIIRSSSNK
jgi:hypothetical protein